MVCLQLKFEEIPTVPSWLSYVKLSKINQKWQKWGSSKTHKQLRSFLEVLAATLHWNAKNEEVFMSISREKAKTLLFPIFTKN